MQKTTFVNRNKDTNNQTRVVNAQKIIDYFLSLHKNNRVIVNSPLYNLAVKQYNETVKATKIRPPIPKWFCGKINAVTGELVPEPQDEQLRLSSGVVSDPTTTTIIVPSKNLLTYDTDICLQFGPPGSYGYSKCEDEITDEEIETSGIDWASSIASWTVDVAESESSGSSESSSLIESSEGENSVTSLKLTVTGISRSMVYFSWTPTFDWGTQTIVECFRANGSGGKFDWIRRYGQSVKELKNIRNGYIGGGANWVTTGIPKSGEKVKFRWRTVDGSKSSNLASATWVN